MENNDKNGVFVIPDIIVNLYLGYICVYNFDNNLMR